jgi:hypothetical protein
MILPTHLTPTECQALERIVHALTTNFSEQIRFIALFGSKARGDFGPDSDMDLLIISEDDDWRMRQAIRDPVFDIDIECGVFTSPRVIGRERFQSLFFWNPGFIENLQRDALELWRRPGVEDPLAQSASTLTPQPA